MPDLAVRLLVVAALVAVAATAMAVRRRRDGEARPVTGEGRLSAADVGAELGERATLLQVSSAFCAPCRATRGVLARVAEVVPGVRHVEVDAEGSLDLVRRLDVVRTPTTFVLDADGAVLSRSTGVPTQAQVVAALGAAVPEEAR